MFYICLLIIFQFVLFTSFCYLSHAVLLAWLCIRLLKIFVFDFSTSIDTVMAVYVSLRNFLLHHVYQTADCVCMLLCHSLVSVKNPSPCHRVWNDSATRDRNGTSAADTRWRAGIILTCVLIAVVIIAVRRSDRGEQVVIYVGRRPPSRPKRQL